MEYWIGFFKNDLITVLKLMVGVALVGHKLPKRKCFPARLIVTSAAFFCWSLEFQWLKTEFPEEILMFSILKYCTVFALLIGGTVLCLNSRGLQAVFCVTVAYCLEHMSQRISSLLLSDVLYVTDPIFQQVGEVLIASTLYFAAYQLLIRHFLCQEVENYKDNAFLLFLAVIVIAADIVLNTTGIHLSYQTGNRGVSLVTHAFSILCSLLVLVISMCTMKMKNAEKQVLIVEQLIHDERSRYKRDNAVMDMLNIKCHDLKHQISMLEDKLDRQELADIRKVIQAYDQNIKTGNEALDVVLYNKSLLCDSQQITLTCFADGNAVSVLSDADIYSLFGNILDNAIDSAGKVQEKGGKIITLTVQQKRGYLFIHEENYYTNEIEFQDGLPKTSKANRKYHGFGMLSIRTLTEKYGGDLQIYAKNGTFKLDIMIPSYAIKRLIG